MSEAIKTKFLVVGSGATGISAGVALLGRGENHFRLISKHSDFGGVWHANRYPGCVTDVPAPAYQLSYAKSLAWTSSHPGAAEMADYLRSVAAKYRLDDRIDFNTDLLNAEWLEDQLCWKVTTNRKTYLAKYLLLATGYLDRPKLPNLKGMEKFSGRIFHSQNWPAGYTGEGEVVAVLGASSSAVQIVPEVQKFAKKLIVFQRTPVHILPFNRKTYSPEEVTERAEDLAAREEERQEIIAAFEDGARRTMFEDRTPGERLPREIAIDQHRATQIKDPALREKLTPKYALGCKRATHTDLFFPAIQQPNVELVDEAAVALGEHSIISASGREFDVDTVVMATGFDWGGDILSRIHRRDGEAVADHQKGHRRAYKSVSLANCPNLFMIACGPNGAVWNGYAPGEIVPEYIFRVLKYMDDNNIGALEVKEEAELAWKREADKILSTAPTMAGGCTNYSLDETGHDMGTWPGDTESMQKAMREFNPDDYLSVGRSILGNRVKVLDEVYRA